MNNTLLLPATWVPLLPKCCEAREQKGMAEVRVPENCTESFIVGIELGRKLEQNRKQLKTA